MSRFVAGFVVATLLIGCVAAVTNTDPRPGVCVELNASRSVDSLYVLVYDGSCRQRASGESGDLMWRVPAPLSRCDVLAHFWSEHTTLAVSRKNCEPAGRRT